MMSHDNAQVLDALDPTPLSDMLGYALRRAQAAVSQDFSDRFATEDIRPTQFALLSLLRRNPGLRQNQVSAALGIKRTNFVPLLDELERRGLAERQRVADDRRAAAIVLTDAGAALLDRLADAARAHEDRFSVRLGAGNRTVLLGLLARLCDPAFDPPA